MPGGTMGRALAALITALLFCGICLAQQNQEPSQHPSENAAQTAPEPRSPEKPSDGVISFAVGKFPIGVASDGTNIWVANAGGTVTKLRASDGKVLGTFNVGKFPVGIAFDGTYIWVANAESNNLMKLRT